MHLIVGLGNPGREYKYTRHNIGFLVVNALSKKLSAQFKRKQDYFWVKTTVKDNPVIIAKPRKFVNLSGEALKKMVSDFGTGTNEILIVHDDADLSLGVLKIKKGGSSAGHRGVESIIQKLGSSDFPRMRIGIGRDQKDLKDYVLSEFSVSEKKFIEDTIDISINAIFAFVDEGIDKAMLNFNRRKEKDLIGDTQK